MSGRHRRQPATQMVDLNVGIFTVGRKLKHFFLFPRRSFSRNNSKVAVKFHSLCEIFEKTPKNHRVPLDTETGILSVSFSGAEIKPIEVDFTSEMEKKVRSPAEKPFFADVS